MQNKLYVGIDVGSKGFISSQIDGQWNFLSIEDSNQKQISEHIQDIKSTNPLSQVVCVIEDVHSVFGSSAKSTFNFGFNKGFLIGLLTAHKIPYVLVAPKEWQKEIWTNSDMAYETKLVVKNGKQISQKKVKTKETSFNACIRLFPELDLRKSSRCKNADDNKVDSILMSEYARRKNL